MPETKALIIGAGPAGITAALQLQRYGRSPVLLEKSKVGGLLRNANLVENYPGFPRGITGPRLVRLFEEQLRVLGVEVRYAEVKNIAPYRGGFRVDTERDSYEVGCVVVASGTRAKPIPIQIPVEARGRIYSEVWPLSKLRRKHVVIIGAGDAAFDYASNLAQRNLVSIFNRTGTTSCLPLLEKRCYAHSRIDYHPYTKLIKVEGINPKGQLLIMIENKDVKKKIEADYLLFAIGRLPNIDFLSDELVKQRDEYIREGRLYFIGDVCNGRFRQTAIAVGDGMRAAMNIIERGM